MSDKQMGVISLKDSLKKYNFPSDTYVMFQDMCDLYNEQGREITGDGVRAGAAAASTGVVMTSGRKMVLRTLILFGCLTLEGVLVYSAVYCSNWRLLYPVIPIFTMIYLYWSADYVFVGRGFVKSMKGVGGTTALCLVAAALTVLAQVLVSIAVPHVLYRSSSYELSALRDIWSASFASYSLVNFAFLVVSATLYLKGNICCSCGFMVFLGNLVSTLCFRIYLGNVSAPADYYTGLIIWPSYIAIALAVIWVLLLRGGGGDA